MSQDLYSLTGWNGTHTDALIIENGKIINSTINDFWNKSFSDIKRICQQRKLTLKFEKQLALNSKAAISK